MNRQSISVQPVTTAEERALLTGLWLAASVESGISPEVASRRASHGAVEVALQRPDVHGFLAYLDGAPAGFLVATESVMRFGEGDELVVTAVAYAQSVRISSEDPDLLLSDNYFSMNPGEKRVRIFRGEAMEPRARSVFDIA